MTCATSSRRKACCPPRFPNTQVRDQLRQWYRSRWLAPNKLKRAALTDTLHGIYLPYWTFDAHVDADWTAESGYYYYVTETYPRTPTAKPQTRQVRKIRWERSAGNLSHFFDDDAVPGTVGVHTELLRKVEPFPTLTDLKPYDPAYVRGWTVERYQVDLRQAAQTSQAADGRRHPPALRARRPRRHPSQSPGFLELSGPHFQTHPRSRLAGHLHLRHASPIRSSSTATPEKWPASIR